MSDSTRPACPECAGEFPLPPVARRDFFRTVGLGAAAVGVTPLLPAVARAADTATTARAAPAIKPAEAMIRDLFASLSTDQKKEHVLPWNHIQKDSKGIPTRLGMYNRAIGKPISQAYTTKQQELLDQIFRAICSDQDGYKRLSRGGTFDASHSFGGIGANIFGDPTDGKKFSLVFAGHHLTVRCDGNSEPGAAFGGPMYYGHSPNGYTDKNVFFYQTKQVMEVFDALNGQQRTAAMAKGDPGGGAGSVRFRKAGEKFPGLLVKDLAPDQKGLIEKVMRELLSPFRKEDADEVMALVKTNGGMDAIHLAFYTEGESETTVTQPWTYWRLEGPGFVWNFRVLPHVHTFVNIAEKA